MGSSFMFSNSEWTVYGRTPMSYRLFNHSGYCLDTSSIPAPVPWTQRLKSMCSWFFRDYTAGLLVCTCSRTLVMSLNRITWCQCCGKPLPFWNQLDTGLALQAPPYSTHTYTPLTAVLPIARSDCTWWKMPGTASGWGTSSPWARGGWEITRSYGLALPRQLQMRCQIQ